VRDNTSPPNSPVSGPSIGLGSFRSRSGGPVLASVTSATLLGVDGHVVTVEVHVSSGLPAFTIVGLPDTIVRESRERVRAALLSSELEWPGRRITVNLGRTHCC
jgi:hypothetical protein